MTIQSVQLVWLICPFFLHNVDVDSILDYPVFALGVSTIVRIPGISPKSKELIRLL